MNTKLSTCLFVILASLTNSYSQELRLNTYGAYAFDDFIDSYNSTDVYFYGTLHGGIVWGGGLEYKLDENYGLEILYLRLDSDAPVTFDDGVDPPQSKTFKYALNFIMLANNGYLSVGNGVIEPFAGIQAGAAVIEIKNPEPGGTKFTTKFAVGAQIGFNIWMGAVALRLQGQLMSVVQAIGGIIYFGPGGSGVGINTYSSMMQLNVGGGLIFRLAGG